MIGGAVKLMWVMLKVASLALLTFNACLIPSAIHLPW